MNTATHPWSFATSTRLLVAHIPLPSLSLQLLLNCGQSRNCAILGLPRLRIHRNCNEAKKMISMLLSLMIAPIISSMPESRLFSTCSTLLRALQALYLRLYHLHRIRRLRQAHWPDLDLLRPPQDSTARLQSTARTSGHHTWRAPHLLALVFERLSVNVSFSTRLLPTTL